MQCGPPSDPLGVCHVTDLVNMGAPRGSRRRQYAGLAFVTATLSFMVSRIFDSAVPGSDGGGSSDGTVTKAVGVFLTTK